MSRPVQNFRDIKVTRPVMLGSLAHGSVVIDLNPDRVDYVTTDGVEVWIERPAQGSRGQQATRFVDAAGNQVGPVHKNLVPAICWAMNEGWTDPSVPDWFNESAVEFVRSGGAERWMAE